MKKIAVLSFWAACLLLWVFALCLAVRFFSRAAPHNRVNYANSDAWTTQNLEAPAPPRTLHTPAHPVTWAESVSAVSEGADGFCSWGIPDSGQSDERKETRRRRFLSLSEEDRLDYVTVHCEVVCVYDSSGCKMQEYTAFLDQRSGFGDELAAPHPERASLDNVAVKSVNGDVSVTRDPRDGKTYVFAGVRERRIESTLRSHLPLPPGTPWEVPYLRYKKSLRGSYSGLGTSNHQTNRFGYVSAEIDVPKPEGVFRIVCLGGSTTEEWGSDGTYPGEGSFPDIVQNLLRQRFPGKAIEVVNCGVSGKNSTDSLTLLPDYLFLEPDLILMYDGLNDVRVLFDCAWSLKVEPGASAEPRILPADEILDRDLDAYVIRNFHAIARVARCLGIPVVLCSNAAPDPPALTRQEREHFDRGLEESRYALNTVDYCRCVDRLNARIRALCERERMLYIPVHENMGGGFYYFYDICHMVQRGIARKAEIITEHLSPYLSPVFEAPPAAKAS